MSGKLQIRETTKDDLPSLKPIAVLRFGEDFAGDDHFLGGTDNQVSLHVRDGDKVVAYGTAGLATFSTKKKAEDYLEAKGEKLESKWGEDTSFGIRRCSKVPHDPTRLV